MKRGGRETSGRRERRLPFVVRLLLGFVLFLLWFVPLGCRVWDANHGRR